MKAFMQMLTSSLALTLPLPQVRVEVRAADGGEAAGAGGGAGEGGMAGGGNVGEVRVVLNLMDLLGLHSYLQLLEVCWLGLMVSAYF